MGHDKTGSMGASRNTGHSLAGQFLIAMPSMGDPRFAKTVIYLCVHDTEGAMGLVINKTLDTLQFPDILDQLGITSTIHLLASPTSRSMPVVRSRPVAGSCCIPPISGLRIRRRWMMASP